MADESKTPRKWTLEEIDELLQDSGMLPRDFNSPEDVEEVAPTPKKTSFNPRPTRNEGIRHKIISEKVERSDAVAEPQVYGTFVSEKYRERFSDKPEQIIAKTAEIPLASIQNEGKGEGAFKTKTGFTKTGSFSATQVVSQKTTVAGAATKSGEIDDEMHKRTGVLRSLANTESEDYGEEYPEADDAQLMFDGFHTEEAVEQVDEAEVEAELIEKRKDKVSSFTITSEITSISDDDSPKLYGTDEYRTSDDKFKVKYYLKKKRTAAFAGAVVSFVCGFLLILISALSLSFQEYSKIFILADILLLAVSTIFNFSFIADGVKAVNGFKFNKNTGCFMAVLSSLIQCIVLLFCENPFETGVSLFSTSALLAVGLNVTGEYFEIKRIFKNFEYITSGKALYTINHIADKGVADEISKGLLINEPKVICSQKTAFPLRFIELSGKTYPSDGIGRKIIPLSFAFSLLIGAVTLVISKDIKSAVASFSGCICVGVPYFSAIADSFALTKICEKLLKKGVMLSGWSALTFCENANAIAVDSSVIFDKNKGNVSGIHPFNGMSADEAIIYAASLTIASGGPAGNIFKRVIVGDTSILPPVDSLTYEDKLGLSAWVFNRRVLVGSADLLINHNVEIPDTQIIKKRLESDRGSYPMYLAIDGKAAAVFIVNYGVNIKNKKLLKEIENNGISILLRSDDANITDDMVSEKLSLSKSGIKVISAVSGETYKAFIKETTTAGDACLIHDGDADSFLYAVEGALSLSKFKNAIKILQICACGIGLALVAVLSFVSGLKGFGGFSLVLLQAFFTVVCALIIAGGQLFYGKKKKSEK